MRPLNITIPLYIDTLSMTVQEGAIAGRAVANEGMVRALAHNEDIHLTLVLSSLMEAEVLSTEWPWLDSSAATKIVCLHEHAKLEEPDIIHHLGPDLYRPLAFRQAKGWRQSRVTGMTHTLSHNVFVEWLALTGLASPRVGDALIATSQAAKLALAHLCDHLKPRLPDLGWLEFPVIPLGITPPQETTSIPHDTLTALYVGRLSQHSKCDLKPILSLAAQLYGEEGIKLNWVFAGALAIPQELEELHEWVKAWDNIYPGFKQHIQWHVNPTETNKSCLYRSADFFVAASDNFQETFGLTVLEAMSFGLPVIAANWNGYRDLVTDGQTGFLIPTYRPERSLLDSAQYALQHPRWYHDIEAQQTALDLVVLGASIQRLVHDDNLRRSMSEAARLRANEFFWPHVIEKWIDYWRAGTKPSYAAGQLGVYPLTLQDFMPHYASHMWNQETEWELTTLGLAMTQTAVPLAESSLHQGFMDWKQLADVLHILKDQRIIPNQESQIQACLAYALKMGLIRRTNPSQQ